MIEILNKQDCCGCEACVQICPKNCITMQADDEGFLYPIVNKEICIGCGLCNKVCPMLQTNNTEKRPIKVVAAINNNIEQLENSSSGGVFIVLAQHTIKNGGKVYGAAFDKNWHVKHQSASTEKECEQFMGSKYVQSSINNTYNEAQKDLKKGKQVLFSGTPCQIAGLNNFLKKDYENLTTCDFICHGVPSPGVWSKYITAISEQQGKITNINFRDKTNGWKNFHFYLKNENDNLPYLHEHHRTNIYMKAFLQDIILRPSCYACKHRSGKSGSDITLADYWDLWKTNPDFDNEKGVSMVLVNTTKGETILNAISNKVATKETSFDDVLTYQKSWYNSPKQESQLRNQFYKQLKRGNNIQLSLDSVTKNTVMRKVKNKINKLLDK